MAKNLTVSVSPHLHDGITTQTIMRDVLIALVPAVVASVVFFGVRALLVEAVCVAVAILCEWAFEKICKRPITVSDLSAAVTGLLLALNLPSGIPLWQAAFGAFVAIVLVKQMFGGIGYNFANPALVGRIALFLGFATRMTDYVYPDMAVDALASATPLAVDAGGVSLLDMFLGLHGGMMGEVCTLAILLGLAYLLATRTISFAIPGSIVITMFVLEMLATGFDVHVTLVELMGGGLLFGAVFMATDYVTSPFTTGGKVIYGIFIGLLTFIIRSFGSMNEGMSFAILMGNLLTPWFNAWTHQIPLGRVKPGKAKKDKKAAAASAGKGGAA